MCWYCCCDVRKSRGGEVNERVESSHRERLLEGSRDEDEIGDMGVIGIVEGDTNALGSTAETSGTWGIVKTMGGIGEGDTIGKTSQGTSNCLIILDVINDRSFGTSYLFYKTKIIRHHDITSNKAMNKHLQGLRWNTRRNGRINKLKMRHWGTSTRVQEKTQGRGERIKFAYRLRNPLMRTMGSVAISAKLTLHLKRNYKSNYEIWKDLKKTNKGQLEREAKILLKDISHTQAEEAIIVQLIRGRRYDQLRKVLLNFIVLNKGQEFSSDNEGDGPVGL